MTSVWLLSPRGAEWEEQEWLFEEAERVRMLSVAATRARVAPVVGYDASPAILSEALRHSPDSVFAEAVLPNLAGVQPGRFGNLLSGADAPAQ